MSALCGEGLVITARSFGERDVLVTLLCEQRGLVRGLMRGGKGRDALVQPFNRVRYEHYRRLPDQLGTLTLEMVRSRAALWAHGMVGALAVGYVSEVLAVILPEEHPYDGLVEKVDALLGTRLEWRDVLEFELYLLELAGYGLRLDDPVPCGEGSALVYVSPTSGRAVPRNVAKGYEDRLLALPACLGGLECGEGVDFGRAWGLTGYFLGRALHGKMLASRARLGDYYGRNVEKSDALAA